MISTRTLNTIQDYSLSALEYREIERLFQDNGIGRSIIYSVNTKQKLYDAHMVTLNICREETKLSFVAEAIEKIYRASLLLFHPEVEVANSRRTNLVKLVRNDGYELVEGKLVSVDTPVDTLLVEYPKSDFSKIYSELKSNKKLTPDMLIGKSKDMLESLFKTICDQQNIVYDKDTKFDALQKKALENFSLIAVDCTDKRKTEDYIRTMITAVVVKINEVRNIHGYGHGKNEGYQPIDRESALLISNLALSISTYFIPKVGQPKSLK